MSTTGTFVRKFISHELKFDQLPIKLRNKLPGMKQVKKLSAVVRRRETTIWSGQGRDGESTRETLDWIVSQFY